MTVRYKKIKRKQVIAAKTEVDMSYIPQTVNRKSTARGQAERQSKLNHNQRAPQAVPAGTERGASTLFQHIVQV